MNKVILEFAFNTVNEFTYINIETNKVNKFEFEFTIPSVSGIHHTQKGKDFKEAKQNTLKYIIFNLHNAEKKSILDAIISLLYSCKIRKGDTDLMIEEYNHIFKHYSIIHNQEVEIANIENKAIVYSISFCIGSNQIHKIGYTEDKNRYSKLLSDIRTKYPFVSVGSFKVNQEIQFDDITKAKEYEQEQLTKLKQDISYKKCKYCFDGYKEAYYSNNPYKLL